MDEKKIIPDSLTFDFIPECKDCKRLDLITTDSLDLFYDDKIVVKRFFLSCSHLESCKAVIEAYHNHK